MSTLLKKYIKRHVTRIFSDVLGSRYDPDGNVIVRQMRTKAYNELIDVAVVFLSPKRKIKRFRV